MAREAGIEPGAALTTEGGFPAPIRTMPNDTAFAHQSAVAAARRGNG
jgi:hypothetical protein